MQLDLHDVPSGVATMTDRVLPNIFPTGDEQFFTAALAETVGVERPPPKGFEDRATTFASLDTLAGDNFFSDGIKHRLVVLLTDGETSPYFAGDLRESVRPPPRTNFVIVRVGGPTAHLSTRSSTAATVPIQVRPETASPLAWWRRCSYNAGQAAATQTAKRLLGTGPLAGVGHGLRAIALAPWLALASLLPLLWLLWSRNLAP